MSDQTKILVTTDFSDQALPAVQKAARLALRLGGRIELIYVAEDHLPPILMFTTEAQRESILEDHAEKAGKHLETYAETHLSGCDYSTRSIAGDAAQKIIQCAKEMGADMIVMSSRGYGPVRQLFIGSTAQRVLHHAECPVLIVPSKS